MSHPSALVEIYTNTCRCTKRKFDLVSDSRGKVLCQNGLLMVVRDDFPGTR